MLYPFFDSTYILIIFGIAVSMIASGFVKRTFNTYNQVKSQNGYTATDAARFILEQSGIHDVRIERVRGDLTDHYDSRAKVLRLSDTTANSTSVAAIGVAAHEVGHAIQDQKKYIPLRLRAALVPAANFGQTLSMPMIMIGVFSGMNQTFLNLGILFFSFSFLFQVVTLPVEFNASGRALRILSNGGILNAQEVPKARKVLVAAAMTYVAAAFMSFLQLLRLLLLFGGGNNDD